MIVNCSNGRRAQIVTTGNLTGLKIESLTLDIDDVRNVLGMGNADIRNYLEGLLYRFAHPNGADRRQDQLDDISQYKHNVSVQGDFMDRYLQAPSRID